MNTEINTQFKDLVEELTWNILDSKPSTPGRQASPPPVVNR